VLFDDGADVEVGVKADHDGVIRRNARADDGKHGGADDTRSRHRAAVLELDREENGVASLDGEGEDETGGVVGEQVAEVLLEHAEELAVVDEVERRGAGEVPAAGGRQQAAEQDADQVDGVGDGQRQQVDVGRHLTHLGRREDEHAERVADQTGSDEQQRRADEDADRRHDLLVGARHSVAGRVERTAAVRRQTVIAIQAAAALVSHLRPTSHHQMSIKDAVTSAGQSTRGSPRHRYHVTSGALFCQ